MPWIWTLYLLLASPLFLSYSYSYDKSITPVVLAFAALLFAWLLLRQLAGGLVNARLRTAVFTAGCALIGGFQLARLVSFYFQGKSFNTQFFYHLEFTNALQAWAAYLPLLLASCGYLCALIVLALRARIPHAPRPDYRRMAVFAVLVIVLEPDIMGYLRYRQEQISNNYLDEAVVDDNLLLQYHLDPEALRNQTGNAAAGKNLVLIYLESLEATYLDAGIFGDLTPNLRRLSAEGLNFSDMQQTAGTGYTMAGIVATQCGTPMLFAAAPDGNDILNNGFLNSVSCLGDVLHSAGYEQAFLGGAALEFAGKGQFLAGHHYDAVLGRAELAETLSDPSYQTGWGLYDDTLLDLARQEYARLADRGAPFNLTVLTLDTHHPVGEASASCPPYPAIDNTMLHAVHCSDYLINAFLQDLAMHPAWKDTVVVLVSDHYAMRNAAQQYYPPYQDRRLLFTVLNAGASREITAPGTLMDVAPTILDVLQVRHDTAFLAGSSLLAEVAAPLTFAEITDHERNNLIGYLNSEVLTSKSVHICENGRLLTQEPGHIQIADRDIVISSLGQPLPEGSLRETHTFLAFWDAAGYLVNSMIVANDELPALLYRSRGENFVTLGNAGALPAYLKADVYGSDKKDGVVALMGNLLGSVHALDIQDNGDDTLVANSIACGRILNTIVASTDPQVEPAILESFCADRQDAANFMNRRMSRLHLELVYFDGGWFEAELRRNEAGQFFPASYRALDTDVDGICYAFITDTELFIPKIRIGDGQQALSLSRLPGDELLFELN